MKRTAALATCATLAITFAACGDDDDAAGDSAPATADAGAGDGTDAAEPPASAVAVEPASSDAADSAPTGSGNGDADPELVADCQAYVDATADLEAPDAPAIDEDISDETRDAAQEAIDASESIDLQSGQLDDAIREFVEALQAVADGGTFTQEMQDDGIAAGGAIAAICSPLISS